MFHIEELRGNDVRNSVFIFGTNFSVTLHVYYQIYLLYMDFDCEQQLFCIFIFD